MCVPAIYLQMYIMNTHIMICIYKRVLERKGTLMYMFKNCIASCSRILEQGLLWNKLIQLSPLLFSMSFAGACLMVLDIVQSLLVKTGQDRSYSL